jgi:hypothetical protein
LGCEPRANRAVWPSVTGVGTIILQNYVTV